MLYEYAYSQHVYKLIDSENQFYMHQYIYILLIKCANLKLQCAFHMISTGVRVCVCVCVRVGILEEIGHVGKCSSLGLLARGSSLFPS